MTRYKKLMLRIANGERILIDGATGTEVERRGVPQLENAWNGGGALSHPEVVKKIHEDYLHHGAEIIISNTFANTKHAMRDAGKEDQFERANRLGVELAIEAREAIPACDALVAGGISYWSWTNVNPPLDDLKSSVATQAQVMAIAGADLLMLEMMVGIERMLITLEAAQSSGLPVWVGISSEPTDESGVLRLRSGEPVAEAIDALKDKKVPLINFMHTQVEDIDACLDVASKHWAGPIGVYAHTGVYRNRDSKWVFDDTISPPDYADACQRWLSKGVQVIGGCCGIRSEHIEAIAKII